MVARCIDCCHFDLKSAEAMSPGVAKAGLNRCKVIVLGVGQFMAATYERECAKFQAAEASVVDPRLDFLGLPKRSR